MTCPAARQSGISSKIQMNLKGSNFNGGIEEGNLDILDLKSRPFRKERFKLSAQAEQQRQVESILKSDEVTVRTLTHDNEATSPKCGINTRHQRTYSGILTTLLCRRFHSLLSQTSRSSSFTEKMKGKSDIQRDRTRLCQEWNTGIESSMISWKPQ